MLELLTDAKRTYDRIDKLFIASVGFFFCWVSTIIN